MVVGWLFYCILCIEGNILRNYSYDENDNYLIKYFVPEVNDCATKPC